MKFRHPVCEHFDHDENLYCGLPATREVHTRRDTGQAVALPRCEKHAQSISSILVSLGYNCTVTNLGPVVNGEHFAPGYTPEAAAYEQRTRK